jgi:hypothetical protein
VPTPRGTGRERGGRRQGGDDLALDLVGVRQQQVERQVLGRLGQADDDAVVAPEHLGAEGARTGVVAEVVRETGADDRRPGRVDPCAERRVEADAPVADLVAEALDDQRAVVGHHPGRLGLLVEVGHDVGRRPLVERVHGAEPLVGLLGGQRPDGAHELAHRPAQLCLSTRTVAVPERHLAGLAGGGGDHDPFEGDVLDAPCRGAEQEGLAHPGLVDHLLVQLADPCAVGQEDAVEAAVGDGAARGHRQALRAGTAPHGPREAVPTTRGRSSENSSAGYRPASRSRVFSNSSSDSPE